MTSAHNEPTRATVPVATPKPAVRPRADAPTAPTAPQADAVPFFDVVAVNAGLDVQRGVARVVERNNYILGHEVRAFEDAFRAYLGAEACVAVANGTDALELALRALALGPGQRVVQAANAGFYAATATHAVGATPLYVDVDAATSCVSVEAVRQALANNADVGCIVVTHLYGQMGPVEEVLALAQPLGIPVVEDCAQAHGARRNGRMAGTQGTLGCFSFYPTKNLGALGDAGAVVARDVALAEQVRKLRQYGWGQKYEVAHRGGKNSRMDEFQAAFLLDKLPALDAHNASRQQVAARYHAGLAGLPLRLPPPPGEAAVCHLFVVQTPERDALAAYLRARAIATAVHYPKPDHLQPAYPDAAGEGGLPTTEALAASVLSLPCYPGMPAPHVERVVGAVRAFYADAQAEADANAALPC